VGFKEADKKPGSWQIKSASDPRWNREGRAEYLYPVVVGMPPEAVKAFGEMKKEFGPPPRDVKWAWKVDNPEPYVPYVKPRPQRQPEAPAPRVTTRQPLG